MNRMVKKDKKADKDTESTKPTKTKKARGRPPGTNSYYVMKNGVFKKEDLFLYAPENTIPKGEHKRYLEQCDNMLSLLDARTVNKAELEEIAKVYREGVIVDAIFRGLTQTPEGEEDDGNITLDATTINSLDKILKTVEKRKENLAVRARDRQESRNLSSKITMMDVIHAVGSDIDKMENVAAQLNTELEKEAKKFTSTEKFMEEKVGHLYDEEEDNIDDDN